MSNSKLFIIMMMYISSLLLVQAKEYSTSGNYGGVKMWIPDELDSSGDPIKGLLITSAWGAGKHIYSQGEFREFATAHDFACIQVARSNSSSVYNDAALICNWASAELNRPELSGAGTTSTGGTLPTIWGGNSADGQTAVYRGRGAYDTTLAVLNYRGRLYKSDDSPINASSVPAHVNVPVLEVMSYNDFKDGRTTTMEINTRDGARAYHNAPWSTIMQPSGHADTGDEFYAMQWLTAVVAMQMPEGGFDKDRNPLLPPDTGANARGATYELEKPGSIYVFSNPEIKQTYDADSRDIWLPNQEIADLWMASNQKWNLSYTVSGPGSINASNQEVWGTHDPSVKTVIATPGLASRFVKWTLNGEDYSTEPTITVENVVEHMDFVATFELIEPAAIVATADEYTALANTRLSVPADEGLLANDAGLNLTARLSREPAHGSVSVNADGSFAYTPDDGFLGSDSFSYIANNGTKDSQAIEVNLDVKLGLREVVLLADVANSTSDLWEGAGVPYTLNDPFAYDPMSYADPLPSLSFSVTTGFHATVPNAGDAILVYTLEEGSITAMNKELYVDLYGRNANSDRAKDIDIIVYNGGINGTEVARVDGASLEGAPYCTRVALSPETAFDTIVVVAHCTVGSENLVSLMEIRAAVLDQAVVGSAPVAYNDSYNLYQDVALNVSAPGILSNDAGGKGPLTTTKVSDPANGALTLNSDGSFTYTPHAGFIGSDSFTYKANGGSEDSNVATVNLVVNDASLLMPIAHWNFDESSGSTVADATGNGFDGTATAPTWGAGKEGNAMTFNGSSSWISVPKATGFIGGEGYAVSLWFKTTNTGSDMDLLSLYDASGNAALLLERRGNGALRFLHRVPVGASGGTDLNSPIANYADDSWHHMVAVKDSDSMVLYVDGAEVAITSDSSMYTGGDDLYITMGRLSADQGIRYWNGGIDDIRLFDLPLSAQQVANLYEGEGDPVVVPEAISVNWNGIDEVDVANPTADLGVVADSSWANLDEASMSASNVDGSTMDISWSSAASWYCTVGEDTSAQQLFRGRFDEVGNGFKIELSQIPFEQYDVIVYYMNKHRWADVKVGNQTFRFPVTENETGAIADDYLNRNGELWHRYVGLTGSNQTIELVEGDRERGSICAIQVVASSGSISHEAAYGNWIGGYAGASAATDYNDDPDADGMDNLSEYAFGANPSQDDSEAMGPICKAENGTFTVIYRRRTDADQVGLTYTVLHGNELTDALTTIDAETGVSDEENGVETVTNTISTATEDSQFLQVEIELN